MALIRHKPASRLGIPAPRREHDGLRLRCHRTDHCVRESAATTHECGSVDPQPADQYRVPRSVSSRRLDRRMDRLDDEPGARRGAECESCAYQRRALRGLPLSAAGDFLEPDGEARHGRLEARSRPGHRSILVPEEPEFDARYGPAPGSCLEVERATAVA